MKKVLLFNFYKGILYRGIPIYSSNLAFALQQKGCIVKEWSCPTYFSKLPRIIIDLIFIFSEQVIIPIIFLFGQYDKVIYPYNSCSVLSVFTNKSLLIIHDFIPNKKNKKKISLSGLYIVITQRIHALFRRDVAFVSATTKRIGMNVVWLKNCRLYLFPNSFYSLEKRLLEADFQNNSNYGYITLISGNGENKEFTKAIDLWKSCDACKSQQLEVIGLGGHIEWAQDIVKTFELENVKILPVLSDDELIFKIKNSLLIWAHSTHEGFGRPVIEGRICGKNVLASNISAFREHKDDYVFLYNEHSFCEKYRLSLLSNDAKVYKIKYHIILEEQIEKWLLIN
ncbi:glycosyltransferase [Citrobacter sp. wls757]|uniref:Glycosyl transferase n=1 Tax=Citrobacter freundii TaxID=546 RepID=A0A2Z4BX93_CITFR|nr:glycosyltransferase [Citrobacter sp. wls757]AWU66672.1 glycosyl transferase [Citrobacter freundii]TKU50364.1 glycosyltransferase family 4 protein [Citrobacter sp. wls757]